MSTMPGAVAKPPILERLDKLSSDKSAFEDAFTDLKATLPIANELIKWGKDHGLIQTKAEEDHLRDHWFGTWWQNHKKKPEVVKHGLVKAFNLAVDQQKHFDCYWVCSADMFQLFSLLSPHQVTVLVFTPEPPYQTNTAFPDEEDIWLAKDKLLGSKAGEQLEADVDGVYVMRLLKNRNLP